jgi:hypothetical protein
MSGGFATLLELALQKERGHRLELALGFWLYVCWRQLRQGLLNTLLGHLLAVVVGPVAVQQLEDNTYFFVTWRPLAVDPEQLLSLLSLSHGHSVDHRQRLLAAANIGRDWLAGDIGSAPDAQDVIANLEG